MSARQAVWGGWVALTEWAGVTAAAALTSGVALAASLAAGARAFAIARLALHRSDGALFAQGARENEDRRRCIEERDLP